MTATSRALYSFSFFATIFLALAFVRADEPEETTRYEYSAEKMGVPIRVVLYASSEREARAAVDAALERFDAVNAALSDYDPESEITRVCKKIDETNDFVEISAEVRKVLAESRLYCELTNGAFDVTVSPVVKLWRRSRYFRELPPSRALESAKSKVGIGVWELGERGLKTNPGVRFDVGGIAKGVALDEALDAIRALGINSALIDASGDARMGSAPPGKKGWKIGVSSLTDEPVGYCELSNVGICSSGDANRYVEIDGVRYSHIVDPRTCEPLTRRCVSAVIAPTVTTADVLASARCVLDDAEFLEVIARVKASGLVRRDGDDLLEHLLILANETAEHPLSLSTATVRASSFFQTEFFPGSPVLK